MIEQTLRKLGWSEKQIQVYMTLLRIGPSPVRKIATESGINRGTTYDILKALRADGLVAFFHKKTKQYFVAEDPSKLASALEARAEELHSAKLELETVVPQLRSLYANGGAKAVSMLYEGKEGVANILRDVLERTAHAEGHRYYAYSAPDVRSAIYQAMPEFNKQRVSKKVSVRVISFDPGGERHGYDERKHIASGHKPIDTYIFIYAGRVAYLTKDASGGPVGMIIENAGIYQTERQVFESLWQRLPS